jgi:O-antigen/teichoic acid export membrane protein
MGLAGIAGIVIARTLGAAGYGTYSWAFAWASGLAVPAALGADQLLVRESGVALERGGWDGLRGLVRSTLGRVALVSVALTVVGEVGLALAGGDMGARRVALMVALPILPLAAAASLAQGALLGLGRTVAAVAPGMLGRQGVFLVLALVAVLLGDLSSAGAVALQLIATGLACAAALALLRRALARGPRAGPSPAVETAEWMRTSLAMGAAAMFSVLDAQVGLLVIGAVGDAADAGVYAAAALCVAPFGLLLTAGRLPLGGVVARLDASGDRERLQRGLRTATRAVAVLAAPVAAVLLLFPDTVLGLFGAGFSRGADALRILAVAQLVNALCAFNGLVLIMSGQERVAMGTSVISLVLDAVLCAALVPVWGAEGAAVGVLVSVTVRNVANSVSTRRRLGIDTTVLGRC